MDRENIVIGSILTTVIIFMVLIFFSIFKLVDMKVHNLSKAIHSSCNPREYVEELYVPGLLSHSHGSLNSSVVVGLEFKRGEARPGDVAMYRDLSMRLYYGDGEDPVANRTVPRFKMGERRSVRYTAVVDAPRLPWEDALDKISGGSTVLLRLELSGKFKARDRRDPVSVIYDSKCDRAWSECGSCDRDWSEFEAEAQVWVDASARMISKTSILFDD